jgi:hypothetical protein
LAPADIVEHRNESLGPIVGEPRAHACWCVRIIVRFVLHLASIRVENGSVRPSERATTLRRGNLAARSPRRARSRTLFSAGPRFEVAAEKVEAATVEAVTIASPPVADETDQVADFALEEFVVDDDDYPAVLGGESSGPLSTGEPDRVDDIDQWLEEFAVSD